MKKVCLIVFLLIAPALIAGKVSTVEGQKVDKKEAAKISLIKASGSHYRFYFYHVWVTTIDSVDLLDYFKVTDYVLPIPDKALRARLHFISCTGYWPVYPEHEIWVLPGQHDVGVEASGRVGTDSKQDAAHTIDITWLKFNAVAGHEYYVDARFDGDCWALDLHDDSIDSVVAMVKPKSSKECPDSIDVTSIKTGKK